MKICIIGGGLSGTIACKYAVEKGHEPTILEKTNSTGGVYSLIYDKKNSKLSSSKYITSFLCCVNFFNIFLHYGLCNGGIVRLFCLKW